MTTIGFLTYKGAAGAAVLSVHVITFALLALVLAIEFARTFFTQTQTSCPSPRPALVRQKAADRATIVRRNLVLAMWICCVTRLVWSLYSIIYLDESTGKYVDLIAHPGDESVKFVFGRLCLGAYFFITLMIAYQFAFIASRNTIHQHAAKVAGGLVLLVHVTLTFLWVALERDEPVKEWKPIYETSVHFITASTLLLALLLLMSWAIFSKVISKSSQSSASSLDTGLQARVTIRVTVLSASAILRTVMFLYRPITHQYLPDPCYPFFFYYIPEVLLVVVVYGSMPDSIVHSLVCANCCTTISLKEIRSALHVDHIKATGEAQNLLPGPISDDIGARRLPELTDSGVVSLSSPALPLLMVRNDGASESHTSLSQDDAAGATADVERFDAGGHGWRRPSAAVLVTLRSAVGLGRSDTEMVQWDPARDSRLLHEEPVEPSFPTDSNQGGSNFTRTILSTDSDMLEAGVSI